MSCIKTYTGVMFDPLKPDTSLIHITDIAHSLSMLCRANGHFKTFYSVGQHSINCMREAVARGYSRRVQLACLLHDASEAYLADVTRPVKKELPRYLEIEEPLQTAIWSKWLGDPPDAQELTQVFQIDDAILAHEFLSLMDTQLTDPTPEIVSKPVFAFMGFQQCEQEFLRLFRRLTSGETDRLRDLSFFLEECSQTLDTLNIKYAENVTVTADSRLKRCWGSCRKNKDGSYRIRISPVLLEEAVPADSLRDTLYHELLHTVPGAMSHGKYWLQLAQKVNQATGLNIKRSSPASEKGVVTDFANDPSVKLLCVCEGCGAEIVRYRKCDFARRLDCYRCGSCGGKFRVVFNRF